jgi:hypothetical protein
MLFVQPCCPNSGLRRTWRLPERVHVPESSHRSCASLRIAGALSIVDEFRLLFAASQALFCLCPVALRA